MEAAVAVEVPAVEVRERLVGFVEEVAARLPLRRQRENALLYVRGLVEQGGRKSLAADAVSARGDAGPVRVGAAVSGRLALAAGAVGARLRGAGGAGDRRGRLGRRRHRDRQGRQALAGGEAAVLGHAGQDRQLPDHGQRARGRRARHAAAGLAAVSARGVVRRPARAGARRRSRTRSSSRRSRSWRRSLRAGGRLGAAGGADPGRLAPTATTPPSARRLHELGARVRASRCAPRRASTGRRRPSRCPQRNGSTGRPRTVARPDRKPESVRALAERLPATRLEDAALPHDARRARTSRAASPSSASSPPTRSATSNLPPRQEWLIIEWPTRRRGTERLLALQPRRRRAARAARPARPPALDDRARLPAAERRTRARPLRRPQLPRLPPPLRARHLRARLPHPRTPATQKPRGRPDTAAGGAAPAARPALLGRPLPNLPPTRRPRPTRALPPTRVTKSY